MVDAYVDRSSVRLYRITHVYTHSLSSATSTTDEVSPRRLRVSRPREVSDLETAYRIHTILAVRSVHKQDLEQSLSHRESAINDPVC